jgi:2,4-dienoyl-CoA reductase-like NADH-dependent reductase (Old Yellow Enzyme family)
MPNLFDPIDLGAIRAPNRILMAPMTRARGTRDHVPTPRMAKYYADRASAGLIISEAVGVSQQGLGWPYATGLWTPEQVAGWRMVTDAVHEAGGRIIAQLWHMGRVAHSSFNRGERPVSASDTTAPSQAHTYDGKQPYEEARRLHADEIPGIMAQFKTGAKNAIEAGFDGAQLHAANGYLIDQFLRDNSNLRDDRYGGSIDNRIRFLKEATQAVADAIGADRTGVRLSPNGESQGVNDSDPLPLFARALEAMSGIGIGHLELREPPTDGSFGTGDMDPLASQLRPHFKGPLILNSDFSAERASLEIEAGIGDAVAFGRPFIGNPDFVRRIRENIPLASADMDTWFTQGDEGYTDYQKVA